MNCNIVVNGVALHVCHIELNRNKPTIVFLHDSLGCIALWRDFPEQLGAATGCNVLVYDRQGYGQSAAFGQGKRGNDYMELEADVLNTLLLQCNISGAILFGHSDGGTIALIAAAKYPQQIKGVITEGAHIFVEEVTLAGIRDAVQAYETTNLKQRLEKYHGDKTDAVFHAWADTWLTDTYRTWNIGNLLPQITCPVLVIQGEQDEYGTLKQVEGIMRQVSGRAEQLTIPAVGHTPHREAGALVLQRTAGFVAVLLTKK